LFTYRPEHDVFSGPVVSGRMFGENESSVTTTRTTTNLSYRSYQSTHRFFFFQEDTTTVVDRNNGNAGNGSTKAQNRRIIHYRQPPQRPPALVDSGRVSPFSGTTTKLQKVRVRRIVQYQKQQNIHKILELFLKEKEGYGLVELATTLHQLTKFSGFQRDHPILPQILEQVANLEKPSSSSLAMIDTRSYSNICHSIAKVQADKYKGSSST
jgi:hypothetical protein